MDSKLLTHVLSAADLKDLSVPELYQLAGEMRDFLIHHIAAVSYTHLDVYKRQVQYHKLKRNALAVYLYCYPLCSKELLYDITFLKNYAG